MGKKLTTNDWIAKATLLHGNKYDYSKVNYINARTKVVITCPVHGDFEQLSNGHLQGYGCKKCALLNNKKSLQEFVNQANKKHDYRYDYTKTKYTNSTTKVVITCNKHGDFKQTPHHHLEGVGCPACAIENRKSTTEEFIQRSISIHGSKYDYSKVVYLDAKTPVIITCPIHGEFKQTPNTHLNGRGCQECGEIQRHESKKKTTEQFIAEAKEIHGETYCYQKTEYLGIDDAVKISCSKHGEFEQVAYNHLTGAICPYCAEISRQILHTDKDSRIYYIEIKQPTLETPIYKIGISAESNLHTRFSSVLSKSDYKVLWLSKYMSRQDAVEEEQRIISVNKEYRYFGNNVKQPDGEPFISKEFFIKDIRR